MPRYTNAQNAGEHAVRRQQNNAYYESLDKQQQ